MAVPMRLVEIREGAQGVADLAGSRQVVDLSLVEDARLGDYLIVHAGFAIETLDQAEAEATLAMFREQGAETAGLRVQGPGRQ